MSRNASLMLILAMMVLILGVSQETRGQQGQEALALNASSRNSILENLAFAEKHPLLVELLAQAGLGPVLSSPGPYTFFVPGEEACQKLRGQKPEVIRLVLSYHIVAGKHLLQDLKDGTHLRTLSGESISVLRKKDAVYINGARVVEEDHAARNGIRHDLDQLLLPKQLL